VYNALLSIMYTTPWQVYNVNRLLESVHNLAGEELVYREGLWNGRIYRA